MALDLTADLHRIALHIPHLEAAARDESAPPAVRAAVAGELAAWRMALNLAGQDRTVPALHFAHHSEVNHDRT